MAKKRKQKAPRREWTDTEIALLGTMSDAAVARAINSTWAVVLKKRQSLGIQAFGRTNGVIRWGPSDLAFFRFGYSDKEIAKITCRPIEEVKAKRAELAKG